MSEGHKGLYVVQVGKDTIREYYAVHYRAVCPACDGVILDTSTLEAYKPRIVIINKDGEYDLIEYLLTKKQAKG